MYGYFFNLVNTQTLIPQWLSATKGRKHINLQDESTMRGRSLYPASLPLLLKKKKKRCQNVKICLLPCKQKTKDFHNILLKSVGLTLHSKLADEEVERLVLVPHDIKESDNLSLYAILS